MKQNIKTLFLSLSPEIRAQYHSLYVSVIAAFDDGDLDVIPYLFASARPSRDEKAQSEFFERAMAIINP